MSCSGDAFGELEAGEAEGLSVTRIPAWPWLFPGESFHLPRCVSESHGPRSSALLWKWHGARCGRIREEKKYRKVDYNRRVV